MFYRNLQGCAATDKLLTTFKCGPSSVARLMYRNLTGCAATEKLLTNDQAAIAQQVESIPLTYKHTKIPTKRPV